MHFGFRVRFLVPFLRQADDERRADMVHEDEDLAALARNPLYAADHVIDMSLCLRCPGPGSEMQACAVQQIHGAFLQC